MLALDVSTAWGSVALVEQEAPGDEPTVVAELGFAVRASHADQLLGRVELVLALAGSAKTEIDGYVATRGPGSFTGVRVGLGTLRGLGLATGKPCVGIITLEALAEAHGTAERERLVVMEAGRGELYAARYSAASSPPSTLEDPFVALRERVLDPAATAAALIVPGPGTTVGSAELPPGARLARAPRAVAAAAGRVALLGGIGGGTEPPLLAPLYVRPPNARVQRRSS